MNNIKLSFDGKGINVKSMEYSPRLATFSHSDTINDETIRQLGPIMAASPDLLQALKNIVSSAPLMGLPLALEKDIQSACWLIRQIESEKV